MLQGQLLPIWVDGTCNRRKRVRGPSSAPSHGPPDTRRKYISTRQSRLVCEHLWIFSASCLCVLRFLSRWRTCICWNELSVFSRDLICGECCEERTLFKFLPYNVLSSRFCFSSTESGDFVCLLRASEKKHCSLTKLNKLFRAENIFDSFSSQSSQKCSMTATVKAQGACPWKKPHWLCPISLALTNQGRQNRPLPRLEVTLQWKFCFLQTYFLTCCQTKRVTGHGDQSGVLWGHCAKIDFRFLQCTVYLPLVTCDFVVRFFCVWNSRSASAARILQNLSHFILEFCWQSKQKSVAFCKVLCGEVHVTRFAWLFWHFDTFVISLPTTEEI